VETYYAPAAASAQNVVGEGYRGAKELSAYRHRLRASWTRVRVLDSDLVLGGSSVPVLGSPVIVRARVELAGLEPSEVDVQVVLGVTTLHAGSTWNTMPAHTHDRRTECYLYFGLPETERIVHLLGEPDETRHVLVADRQAIISPSWSIHSGCGTSSYSFVWAMAGENQAFGDMDGVDVQDLR